MNYFFPRELLDQLLSKDLKAPTQGQTFVRHLHTFYWQYWQYKGLQKSLTESEAMIVQDFAENRKASYTEEVIVNYFTCIYASF